MSSSERASYSASSAFVSATSGSSRRISRSFESTNRFRNLMARLSIGEAVAETPRTPAPAADPPQPDAIAHNEDPEGRETQHEPEEDRLEPRRRVHLRVA